MKLFLKYFTPALMVFMACLSYYNSITKNQTRWRGGGFGMYTEINWDRNEVWFNNIPDSLNFSKIYKKECDDLRRIPSKENFQKIGNLIKENYYLNNFTIELWKLKYNLEDNRLYSIKVKEEHVK